MSSDEENDELTEELEEIFDGEGEEEEEEEEFTEETESLPRNMREQTPSSSKLHDEITVDDEDEEIVPCEPVGTATTLEGAMKRKKTDGEGAVVPKRVRIREDVQAAVLEEQMRAQEELIEQLVCMGYDRSKIILCFASMASRGMNYDMNTMLDNLSRVEEGDGQRAQMNSPFSEPLQASTSNIMETFESLNDLIRPPPKKAQLPTFVDLCDEHLLRKYLNQKYPADENSIKFAITSAELMAKRLEQPAYVAKVAYFSEQMFSSSELYRFFKDRAPQSEPSGIIDRQGIMKDTDEPMGVLIDTAEAFVRCGGLTNIRDRIKDDAMSIRDIGYLCSILGNLSHVCRAGALDDVMVEAAEKMRALMRGYSDKEIRDERTRREIFEASRKVCKGMTAGKTTSPRYEFFERLLLCGNMDAKKNAIDEIAYICDNEISEGYSVRRWMKSRNILPILLSDHLDHPEYATKIGPILRKLAPVLSEREFRGVWCLQKGRGGISTDIFYNILHNIATGLVNDQIATLFSYCKKRMKQLPVAQKYTALLRITDLTHSVLKRDLRPPIAPEDRKLFFVCYIRFLDSFLVNGMGFLGTYYGFKFAELVRGQPPLIANYALRKLLTTLVRMKERDVKFPFYFSLVHHICMQSKIDNSLEYKGIGGLLAYQSYAMRSTKLVVDSIRNTLKEVDEVERLIRADDEEKARLLYSRLQQAAAAATAAASAASAANPAASSSAAASSSQQPSPATAASAPAAPAPPPSAVTPISNGPSPKRDGSPTQVSPEQQPSTSTEPSPSEAPVTAKENGTERKDETVSVCTPPCTPEPLRVLVSRVGTKEWERERNERNFHLNMRGSDITMRLVQYMNLLVMWQDQAIGDEPLASCSVLALSEQMTQELFSVVVDCTNPVLHRRILPTVCGVNGLVWIAANTPQHHMHNIIKTMLRTLEEKPVHRSLIKRLCEVSPDLVTTYYVEIVRVTAERCFINPMYNKSTDWLEEILRFLWRLVTSKIDDVKEKAVSVLKMILSERYRTLRLLEIFAIARFNEAKNDFTRLHGRPPVPDWVGSEWAEENEGGEGAHADAMEEDKENAERIEVDGDEKEKEDKSEEEEGEQAVDLSLDRRRTRDQSISKEAVAKMLRGMRIESGVASKEDAEFRLSRAIAFIRRIVTFGYLETKPNSSLIVRDRAIPGTMFLLTLRYQLLHQPEITVALNTNESVNIFAERVRKLIGMKFSPLNWPRGYKVRHHNSTVHWEKGWNSVGDQLNMIFRGSDEVHQLVAPSHFNEDFVAEAIARREPMVDQHMHLEEESLGHVAADTKFLPIILSVLEGGTASTYLQDTVLSCVQQLPLSVRPIPDEEIIEVCDAALQLQRPHEALHNLIYLLALLLPPRMSRAEAMRAMDIAEIVIQTGFVPRFTAMIREVDDISDRLSVETITLFHEVCLALFRLFYLNDSGKHRTWRANDDRLPHEPQPIDMTCVGASLTDDDLPQLLRTLMNFTWATIAPRRLDVEKEMNVIITSPTMRLLYWKEKKVEIKSCHRRAMLARVACQTMVELARKYGNWERNVNALLNPSSIDGSTVAFWRDMIITAGHDRITINTRCLLSNLVDSGREERETEEDEAERERREEERAGVRILAVRLVFELGRVIWGPAAAVEYSSSGRNAADLLQLSQKVVKTTERAEFEEGLLEEWIDLEIGFISEERPKWNTKCHISLHVQLLVELLKKLDRETMMKTVKHCLRPLFSQALFPFAANARDMEERFGSYPSARAVGFGLAEGDVRRRYIEVVLFYAQEFPESVLSMLNYLSTAIHGHVLERRLPILQWEKSHRRMRAESFCGPQLNLAQRLHNLSVRDTDARMVKGLTNPSYMCYANSVLQQLVFIPGVCETLFAIGDCDEEYGNLMEEEDIKNGTLLRLLQGLFASLLYSAEPSLSAENLLGNIDLPSGGCVREQQDCVEFYLTLIDKCDMAAEKFNRPTVFKRFLEGVMGYEYACKTCKHRHRGADESFTALNLEIHGNTVDASLDHFMDGALLEGASAAMCEQCGEKRTTLRIGALRSAPTTLCIQLKRFSTYDSNGGKLNSKVDVPRELDLTRFSEAVRTATDEQVDKMFGWFDDTQDEPVAFSPPANCPVRWRYRLVGVIVHSGQLGNGHYTSYVKERRSFMRDRPWFDQWMLINDDRVSVQEDKICMEWQGTGEENTPSAYLLWYELIEDDLVTVITDVPTTVPPSAESTVAAPTPMEGAEVLKMNGTLATPSESTVPMEDTVSVNGPSEADKEALRKAQCDWMDIGLGALGMLEGPLLDLWKCVPRRVRACVVDDNGRKQLSRDVLTESYARCLLQLLEMAANQARRKTGEAKCAEMRRIVEIAGRYARDCLWRTHEVHMVEADNIIHHYRLFISNCLKEHTDLCREWLLNFYDPALQAISEEAYAFTSYPRSIRSTVSAWWHLAQQTIVVLRGDQPALVEAYCSHFVECLRINTLRMDGFNAFFVYTVTNPHCTEYYVKHNILPPLMHSMFYLIKKTCTFGLHGELTSRNSIPIIGGLFHLWREAIDKDLVSEDEFDNFVKTRLHLAMGPMTRHGEDNLMKMVELLITALKTYGERNGEWTGRIAQAILMCLKIDPHRANGLFYVVTTVGKALNPERGRDFYDEILGKRETDAAENGLIYPGIVHMLEVMLAAEKEARQIQQIETALTRTMEQVPVFRERAEPYLTRLDAARIRLAEWRQREEVIKAQAQFSLAHSMVMNGESGGGAAAATSAASSGSSSGGLLPLDACGPRDRPDGGVSHREIDMLTNVSDDEMDDDDDEMMSDEEDFSEGEGPVNLSNHRR